ncbi:MAG: SUMF1/EgtB/PvdO family nonheme iron enzyme [Ardenticatenales bacterium]|nr:SUMF1/EgtB/PvdO family nonheme iron enzyme [Ardenticatenales bacterium]
MKDPYRFGAAFDVGNHPVVGVNWYEALAFCRWLSAKVSYEVRLPSEEAWEKAARGGRDGFESRPYPWGNEYVSGYANIDEVASKVSPYYLQQTSAVGMYPQGASAGGIYDLSGNVWEWTLTKVNEAHVLRGGSWSLDPRDARASSRGGDLPGYRGDFRGFRVACVVPAVSGL